MLAGCLRVSKESIFTGLNNMNVYPITDVRFGEKFGFTDNEVLSMTGESSPGNGSNSGCIYCYGKNDELRSGYEEDDDGNLAF